MLNRIDDRDKNRSALGKIQNRSTIDYNTSLSTAFLCLLLSHYNFILQDTIYTKKFVIWFLLHKIKESDGKETEAYYSYDKEKETIKWVNKGSGTSMAINEKGEVNFSSKLPAGYQINDNK